MDLEEVRSKITDKTRAVVIVTPNNPTGGVLEEDVLKELADIAISNDLMVISDEVYERLVYDGAKHISIASLPGMKERTFTMNGMSKAYAMDGWRLGYVAAPEEYILTMNKFHQHNTTCAPQLCSGGRHRRPDAGEGRSSEDGQGVPAPPGLRRQGHQRGGGNQLHLPQGCLLHLHQLQVAGHEVR